MSANNRQFTSPRLWRTSLGYLLLASLSLSAVLLCLLLIVGSSDRQPIKGPLRNRYDANVGLASARAQSVNEALDACTARSSFPLPGSNNRSLILVAGPSKTPEGSVSPDDLAGDRHV